MRHAPMVDAPIGATGIPQPIVILNRWTLVLGVLIGLLARQPILTTVLFLLLIPAVVVGRRGSAIFALGQWLLPRQCAAARDAGRVEDPRLMRFNNSIAALLLGAAQVAFLLRLPGLGWALALAVAAAAAIALAGFCVGCFLYYQFRLRRFRLLRH